MTGEGRRPLGHVLSEIAKENTDDPDFLRKQEEKPFRAPVVIAVAVIPSEDPKIIELEEIGAVNAAIQNMLLAAHALGLGAIWRTGKPTYHTKMKEFFGLREKDEVLGFVYIGYPELPIRNGKRKPVSEKTDWIEDDNRA